MADFETTTDPNDCRVWGWGILDIDTPHADKAIIGHTIEEFIEEISRYNSTTYFHNLKFDAMFLLDWLLNNGYTHTEDKEATKLGTFTTLISDMGKFYAMTVRWKNGHHSELRDSLKKLPMPVSQIAKAWKLDVGKGEIDYEKVRPVGYVMTAEEDDYIRRDLVIPALALKDVIETGMTKLTVASDSLAEYKKLTGSTHFKRLFPVLDESIDSEVRRAYRGGFTYVDPRFKGRVVGEGVVLDVNSLYPFIMKDSPLPYGEPEFAKGKVKPTVSRPLTIFSVTFTARLKRDHIPCIQIKGSSIFLETEYLREIKEPTTMMVTNIDWELYNAHYDIEVLSYGGGWRFRAAQGMFDNYIDKWSEVKMRETGGKREIAKLHLNSLYGKFASNPNVTSKIPVLDKGVVKLKRGENATRPPVYTAAGVFITSFARDLTIRAAQANYALFAYADTDSLHLIMPSSHLKDMKPHEVTSADLGLDIDVHPQNLGAWKFEYAFEQAFYARAKFYLERKHSGEYENRIAGLPVHISRTLTFDDMVPGKVLHGKLNPKTVPGGVVLKDVPFELKF